MFFKSFVGWSAVGDKGERKMLMAEFIKADDQPVHYNMAALRRMRDKPSENFNANDKRLINHVLEQGPSHLKAYNGWNNIGRKGKRIMVADIVQSSGRMQHMNLTALHNLAANPPNKFSAYDAAIVQLAISEAPAFRR